MAEAHLRNLHVPLSESIYKLLRTEAEQTKKPATVLARQAIEGWLRRRQRAKIHQAVTAYASKFAGTEADLDPVLESASMEHIVDIENS